MTKIIFSIVAIITFDYILIMIKLNGIEAKINKLEDSVPMETIDQMIAELEKLKMTSGVTNQSTWNECLHYCLKTVNEYCKGITSRE